MAIAIEKAQHNDPRLDLGIPVLDLYLDEHVYADDVAPGKILTHLSTLSSHEWLDRCDALILYEERFDPDLDVIVLVCTAIVSSESKIWHVMSTDGQVPTAWEHGDLDVSP